MSEKRSAYRPHNIDQSKISSHVSIEVKEKNGKVKYRYEG